MKTKPIASVWNPLSLRGLAGNPAVTKFRDGSDFDEGGGSEEIYLDRWEYPEE